MSAAVACRRPDSDAELQRVAGLVAVHDETGAVSVLAPIVSDARRRFADDPAVLAGALERAAKALANAATEPARTEAERLLVEAVSLREQASGPDSLDVARTLSALSGVYFAAGRYSNAERVERRALAIRRSRLRPTNPETLTGMRDLASILLSLGRYRDAAALAEESLLATGQSSADRAESLDVLGEVRRVQNRYDDAEAAFREAISLAEATPDAEPLLLAALCNNLAGLYKDQGDFASAEEPLARSLAIRRSVVPPDASRIADATLNMGDFRRMQGRYDVAEPLLTDALAQARAIYPDDSPDLVWFISQLGALRREQGRVAEAETMLRDALQRRERVLPAGHPDIAQSAQDLAELLAANSRTAEAVPLFRRAVAVRELAFGKSSPESAVSMVGLADALWAVSHANAPTALELLNTAAAILVRTSAFPESRVEAYRLKSEILRESGRRREAYESLDSAVDLAETLRPKAGAGERERADLWRRRLQLLRTAATWRVEDGDPAGALMITERARARVFLDQLEAARIDPRTALPAEVREPLERREKEAHERLSEDQARLAVLANAKELDDQARQREEASLTNDLDIATADLERIGEELRRAAAAADGWRSPPRAFTDARAMARALAGRGVAIVYLLGPKASFAFLVRGSGSIEVRSLVAGRHEADVLGIAAGPIGADAIATIVTDSRHGIRGGLIQPSLRATRGIGAILDADPAPPILESELYARLDAFARILLPDPVRHAASDAGEVVIVPDGLLHLVPFEALVLSRNAAGPVFVLDAWPPVRYAPSAAVLERLGERRAQREARSHAVAGTVVSVADPELGGTTAAEGGFRGDVLATSGGWSSILGSLPPLPNARFESDRVVAALSRVSGSPAVHLVGPDATEARMRSAAPDAGVLHLATHGIASESEASVLAGLVFAPGSGSPEDDGLLQLHEVYDLKLNADIVVLSACSTQIGRRVEGEGVLSLSRAFLTAGADRVAATLWPVEDRTIGDIVAAMFEATTFAGRGARSDYATALRNAKRKTRGNPANAHPFYWAGITLTGME